MINYIPEYKSLVVLAEQEPHDLNAELRHYPSTRVTIYGTPENLDALSDYPDIEDVSLRKCGVTDLRVMQGLPRLKKLEVAFGSLASLDLHFCSGTLEMLSLSRLKRLKDLSTIPPMPKLDYLGLQHLHAFAPPDFRAFPNLRQLSIWKTDWSTLSWLQHLPMLETLHISQIKVEDHDWRPILRLERLRYLHGMKDVFRSAAAKEFIRLRPDVRVDQGIPADLEKTPQIKEYFESLGREKGI